MAVMTRVKAIRKRVRITDRIMTPAGLITFWATTNSLAVAMLAGFILSGFGATLFIVEIYGASAAFVFLVAFLVHLVRHREPYLRGFREPPAMAAGATVLFAIGALVLWLGLPFGGTWMSVFSAIAFIVAGVLELIAFLGKA